MKASIRPAEAADIEALLALEQLLFTTDRSDRRAFRRAIRSPTTSLLVAPARERLAGYAIVERRRNARVARLASIAVAPEAQGGGVGRDLLAAAEVEAARGGCDRLRLEVRADNGRARGFYEAAGYTPLDTRPGYYDDGADAVRYEKRLAKA